MNKEEQGKEEGRGGGKAHSGTLEAHLCFSHPGTLILLLHFLVEDGLAASQFLHKIEEGLAGVADFASSSTNRLDAEGLDSLRVLAGFREDCNQACGINQRPRSRGVPLPEEGGL